MPAGGKLSETSLEFFSFSFQLYSKSIKCIHAHDAQLTVFIRFLHDVDGNNNQRKKQNNSSHCQANYILAYFHYGNLENTE